MIRKQRSTTVDDLPKQFVASMRTLFDIMDDKKTGYVKFSDIERRWHENGTKGLPNGVLESLRKVTPTNGMLSFERFCAGLKICLLRHKATQFNEDNQKLSRLTKMANRPASVPLPEKGNECAKVKILGARARPASATDASEQLARARGRQNHANTATVRPNNVLSQQRAISMPQLQSNRTSGDAAMRGYKSELKIFPSASGHDRLGIMTALENWRLGIIKNNDQVVGDSKNQESVNNPSNNVNSSVNRGYFSDHNPTDDGHLDHGGKAVQETGPSARRTLHRRREPRRHTLANGIDYNMLKRMKQLEQERDVLLQGLEAVERARDWYLHQIGIVKDKMQYIGKSGGSEYSSDMHQERLNFQAARVHEVNQHLAALMDSSEKGFLLHMNLAVQHPMMYNRLRQDSAQTIIQRLREQNQMLTEEVGKKSELITQLEREKSALIRELFQARSQYHREPEDATFM